MADSELGKTKQATTVAGYQFWSGTVDTSTSLTLTQDIPHIGVDVGVLSSYQGTYSGMAGVNTYLYTGAGVYMGKTLATDVSGIVTYDLPEREYKVRGDYLGYQWWSNAFTWTASDVVIPEGEVTITVTDSGIPVDGANVYVYTAGGTYMGLYATTDALGEVSFLLPADGGNSTNYNGYKFRADYAGTQTYSDPLLVTADVNNPVSIEVGGSAAVPSLRGASAARQPRVNGVVASPERSHGRGNPGEVQVASLFMLPGMLAGLTNSAIADSNGEHLYYYHSDHLGTPLFLTDVSGTVVWRGEYLPFGEVFSEDTDPDGDGVDVEQPFRFPGQYEDAETRLYYNYFRDYDPQIGRYIEIVGKPSENEPNLYVYTNANPINLIDPLGLAPLIGYEDSIGFPDLFVYNAGFHVTIPMVIPLGFGPNVHVNNQGIKIGAEISCPVVVDAGASVGIKNWISDDIEPGVYGGVLPGRYLGIGVTMRKDWLDSGYNLYDPRNIYSITAGVGLAWPPIPFNISVPLELTP